MTLSNDKPFEDYLRDIHAVDYTGLDDDMPDHFDNWISQLENEELLAHANKFGQLLIIKNI
jgi:hypothetical protein